LIRCFLHHIESVVQIVFGFTPHAHLNQANGHALAFHIFILPCPQFSILHRRHLDYYDANFEDSTANNSMGSKMRDPKGPNDSSQGSFECEDCRKMEPNPPFVYVDWKTEAKKKLCKNCYNLAVMSNYIE